MLFFNFKIKKYFKQNNGLNNVKEKKRKREKMKEFNGKHVFSKKLATIGDIKNL
jgi:hypothetical protein